MSLDDFLACVRDGEIPPEPPDGLPADAGAWPAVGDEASSYRDYCRARVECIERGMWAIVEQAWTRELAAWIGPRRVLEIMAGRGWLAKALALRGVDIIATDNGAWPSELADPLCSIEPLEAVRAVEMFGPAADILLVSWPPCGDDAIDRAARAWGAERPLIYIGEERGGRNAAATFFDSFQRIDELDFRLASWPGFYDVVAVGRYRAGTPAGQARFRQALISPLPRR